MIANRREYKITQAAIRRFEKALESDDHPDGIQDPVFRQLLIDSIKAQIQELQAQLDDYDALCSGKVEELRLESLRELPEALIKARIMARMTQRELAARVGVTEQVVQRDESQRYERASFDRLLLVMTALGLKLVEPVVLTPPAPGPPPEELRRMLLAPRSARQAAH
jgi:hypothetical protein